MELGEGEAKICRLCGQCESIYIDVFGEEGTKRFLGLKIHTRINILIKENDGLPQNICLRCLGTLEFMCDFYDSCHLSQTELMQPHQKAAEEEPQQDSDVDSDKENACPPAKNAKHKAKSSSPDNRKSTKNCLTIKNPSNRETEVKEGNNNPRIIDDKDCTYKVQPTMQTTMQLNNNLVSKKQSVMDNSIVREERSKNEENNDGLKCRRSSILEEINVTNNTIIRNTRSAPIRSRDIIQKSNLDSDVTLENPVRRKRGRKSKLEKMKEAMKRKRQNTPDDYKVDDNQYKRHCLRAVCTNSKSNCTMLPKLQIERLKLDESSENNISNDSPMLNDSSVVTTGNKDCAKKKEDLTKCKAISVITKEEKETDSVRKTERKGQSHEMRQACDVLGEKTSQIKPMVQIFVTDPSDVLSDFDDKNSESKVFAKQNRVTVRKPSEINQIIVSKTMENDSIKLNTSMDEIGEDTKPDLDISDLPLSKRLRLDSGNKSRDKSFGKISELISDEQKQTIETYYTVDMSMVNSEEVEKNVTIIDKKNIRCNICGTLYSRLDKCQVHIWGHLQMKPYQCKACNFATVTVSNVRCHIRKSHLKIKPFLCHHCEKRYATAALLEEHVNTHTGARPFKCKECDFASASRQMLSYHTSTHKPMKDVRCKICGKDFFSRNRLRAHMIVHNKDKVVMCKLCSAYLSSAEGLEAHQRNVHSQSYECEICGKRFKSRKALHNHQNVHAAAKFKCSLCPNVYKTSQILKEHLLKHKGIRKYKCNVCEKTFGQQSHLSAHMAVHSEIRFNCPGCDKAFNRHDNMKIHTKRCKPFLSNPSLKNFLSKKEKTESFSKADVTEYLKDGIRSNSTSPVEDQDKDLSAKAVGSKEKTEMKFCKLGLNISCIKSVNQTWTHSDVFSEAENFMRPTGINAIRITKFNDKLIPESEDLTVL